jgi:hypothetical protein
MQNRFELFYHSLILLDTDFDYDKGLQDVFDFVETYQDSNIFYSHIEQLIRHRYKIYFLCEVYVFTGLDINSTFILATNNQKELLDFINFIVQKYCDMSTTITEFKSMDEALNSIDKKSPNLN